MSPVILFSSSILLFSLATLPSAAMAASSGVYKWVDEKGTVHYTAYPPKNRESEKLKSSKRRGTPKTADAPPSSSSDDKTSESPSAGEEPGKANEPEPKVEYEKDPNRCAIAKKNLSTLKSAARVRLKDEDGKLRFLSDKEHKQQMEEAAKAIDESC